MAGFIKGALLEHKANKGKLYKTERHKLYSII